jgi:hypothetical protein
VASMQASPTWPDTHCFTSETERLSGRLVVSESMLAQLHRPKVVVPAFWTSVPIQDLHYALGWFTGEYRGVHLVFHNGANTATLRLVGELLSGAQ